MQEYELVWEIFNECANNQMRDVFFRDVTTDDPEKEVQTLLKDSSNAVITREDLSDGSIVFHVDVSGLLSRYTFTPV